VASARTDPFPTAQPESAVPAWWTLLAGGVGFAGAAAFGASFGLLLPPPPPIIAPLAALTRRAASRRLPADIPGLLQAVQDGGHAAGGEAEQAGQGGGGERAVPAEDVQGAHAGAVEAVVVGGGLVEPVDLRAQRRRPPATWPGSARSAYNLPI
jgi:hypothetical protein